MLKLFLPVVLAVSLFGCATTQTINSSRIPPKDSPFDFDGHLKMAQLIDSLIAEDIHVKLALSTTYNDDFKPESTQAERKQAIQDYETKLSIALLKYFYGETGFSIVDSKGLSPIDKANFILHTDINYTYDYASYYGKLIDFEEEQTIGYFNCRHSGTIESIQCY